MDQEIDISEELRQGLLEGERMERLIVRACHWLAGLFERHQYQLLPSKLIRKLAKRRSISYGTLTQARLRMYVTFVRLSKPKIKWFWKLPTPTERLIIANAPIKPVRWKKDVATDLLIDLLSNGPKEARAVWDEARKRGISMRVLHRAKKICHVRSKRTDQGWVWYLTD